MNIFICNYLENSIENRIPLLYVDVNLGANRTERIVVFEGDESEELAERFVQEHGEFLIMFFSTFVVISLLFENNRFGC